MRIKQLDLLCYGHFFNTSLDFSSSNANLHIIYGSNEAGKSTALHAISDLLFGINARTPYNFRYDHKDLRLGAVLQHVAEETSILAFRRRKGNKDTLRNYDDSVLPDSILRSFLHDVDRNFFQRMFSLNHERLREGGKEILNEKNDIGSTLFAASSGLLGLGNDLKRLESQADTLWAPRKSNDRHYYKARNDYEEAEARKKEGTTLAANWKKLEGEFKEAVAAQQQQQQIFKEKTTLREKLERIRRIMQPMEELKHCEERLASLHKVPSFPDNAADSVENAEKELYETSIRLASLTEQIHKKEQELMDIVINEPLLRKEQDIRELDGRRAIIVRQEQDLPQYRATIDNHQKNILSYLTELQWQPGQTATALLFPQTLIAHMERLIQQKSLLDERFSAAADTLQREEHHLASLREAMGQLGSQVSSEELAASISYVRKKGDIEKVLTTEYVQQARLEKQIAVGLKKLLPWHGTMESLESMQVPSPHAINQYRQDFQRLQEEQLTLAAESSRTKEILEDITLQSRQLLEDKQLISSEALEEARQHRNSGWHNIRRHYIDKEPLPAATIATFGSEKERADMFEQALNTTDSYADRRFIQAKEAAQLTEYSRKKEQLASKLLTLDKKIILLHEEHVGLTTAWHALWEDCAFVPKTPQDMLNWLEKRTELLDYYNQKLDSERMVTEMVHAITMMKTMLITALKNVSQDGESFNSASLQLLLSYAEGIKSTRDACIARAELLEKQIATVGYQHRQANDNCNKAAEACQHWLAEWKDALRDAAFDRNTTIESAALYLDYVKKIKWSVQEIHLIQSGHIDIMERDIQLFHEHSLALTTLFTLDGDSRNAIDSIKLLMEILEKEKRAQTLQNALHKDLALLHEKKREVADNHKLAQSKLKPFLEIAATDNLVEVKDCIRQHYHKITLETNRDTLIHNLIRLGDGKSLTDLAQECSGADPDTLAGEIAGIQNDVEESNRQLHLIIEQKTRLETEREKISGSADSASAETDRQMALTEMGDAAEHYIKYRTAALLLRWGIEKFKKERQAPLLQRASSIFHALTLGSFEKLLVDFDDNDTPILAAMRADSTHTTVDGMSDGTIDQLYLALRLASIEDYSKKAPPLPFIADDLFINYDDKRAAAGFKSLLELARHTQVLFFTHHEHLIEIIHHTVPSDSVAIHRLA